MRSSRRFIVIVVIVVIALVAVLLGLRHQSAKPKQAPAVASHKVVLSNASQSLGAISQSDILTIESTLYTKLTSTVTTAQGQYTGQVRQGSFTEQTQPYSDGVTQIPYYAFIVDIPEAKRSFSVALSGGPQYPFDTLYVLCPTADQIKYGPFDCQDPEGAQ